MIHAPLEVPEIPILPATYDIVWSLVSVAIIAVAILKFALPKITQILDERAAAIEGGIRAGELAREEAASLRATFDNELAEARKEAAAIRERAANEGKQIIEAARKKADAEAQRIASAANRQIDADRQAAEISLRTDLGLMASELASRIVGETLTNADAQTRVIDRFLAQLEASTPVTTKEQ